MPARASIPVIFPHNVVPNLQRISARSLLRLMANASGRAFAGSTWHTETHAGTLAAAALRWKYSLVYKAYAQAGRVKRAPTAKKRAPRSRNVERYQAYSGSISRMAEMTRRALARSRLLQLCMSMNLNVLYCVVADSRRPTQAKRRKTPHFRHPRLKDRFLLKSMRFTKCVGYTQSWNVLWNQRNGRKRAGRIGKTCQSSNLAWNQ